MSSSKWTSVPRVFPTSGFELVDPSWDIEEIPRTYEPRKILPSPTGEILNDRYQVLAKLGYGVTSTVWFGRNLVKCNIDYKCNRFSLMIVENSDSKHVSLKVHVTSQGNHGLDIYNRMNLVEADHLGQG